jgi:superfamily II DNA or RNA helicase
MQHFAKAKHVGLSATPQRLDGKGLDDCYRSMVVGPSVSWLIQNKYLVPYRAFAPNTPDMTGVHTRMGDYNKAEVEGLMDRPTITGDAIREYSKRALGRRAVVFCISIAHSQHVAESFRAAGIIAVHLDGNTPKPERKSVIAAFKRNEIQVLCNVDLFGEGFDLPALEVCIMLRPTESLALYLQQVGRALRTSEGKTHALILDHAGNVMRHGLPDDDREWSLEGRKKADREPGEREEPIKQCEKCFHVHAPAPKCPNCGFVYEVTGREVAHVDGELQELDVEALRRAKMVEQGRARDLEQLVQVGKARGMNNPQGWARHVLRAREEKERKRLEQLEMEMR